MTLTLSPSEIRYSQDSISNKFSDGKPLTSTFARLISGQLSVSSLPAIECVQKSDSWYAASGNRRLFLYKKLQEAGSISTITALRVHTTGGRNFTTKCSGLSIRCRGSTLEYQIQEIISQWKKGEDVVATWGTAPVSSVGSSFTTYRDIDFDPYDDFDLYDCDRYDDPYDSPYHSDPYDDCGSFPYDYW